MQFLSVGFSLGHEDAIGFLYWLIIQRILCDALNYKLIHFL